jgi:hypothetical protein
MIVYTNTITAQIPGDNAENRVFFDAQGKVIWEVTRSAPRTDDLAKAPWAAVGGLFGPKSVLDRRAIVLGGSLFGKAPPSSAEEAFTSRTICGT